MLPKDLCALFTRRIESAVTKTRDRSHVLWIGTDRDPFVFALSSCSGVRLVETPGEGAIALVVRQHKCLKNVKISERLSSISDILDSFQAFLLFDKLLDVIQHPADA